MLTCYMCGETKAVADFAFADLAKGSRQRHCRKCQAAYRRAHYLANREEYIRREVARMKKYRIENRALIIAYLLTHPCVDCGRADPVMLDFDHRDPAEKTGNVTELALRKPWRLVILEIAKCDVRCANCHLRRTAWQFGWRKVNAAVPTDGAWLARQLPVIELASSVVGEVDTKVCSRCRLKHPVNEFSVKNPKTGRRGTWCRQCRSAYGKRHYQENRDRYCARVRAAHREGREPYWAWVMNHLASHPCVDCGEADPVVLQFDHRDGTEKVDDVGTMLNRGSWKDLLNEIAKCDVRCANCHRIRTAQQNRWAKGIRESA